MSTLAAARADNFYFPQNWDPSKGGLNKFHNSHPLGNRASKIDQGILVIRYETPFHVQCFQCENMIAKGVRFNAEKQKSKKQTKIQISTIIYEFQMRCPRCSNNIVVHTDPQNCDYQYVEGAKKFLSTENATDMEFMKDQKEREKLKTDAFFALENKTIDFLKADDQGPRIQQILQINDRMKKDFDLNLNLRQKFREEKQKIEIEDQIKSQPKNLGIQLLQQATEDEEQARKREFSNNDIARQKFIEQRELLNNQSVFQTQSNKDIDQLKKKLMKLPNSTQKALKLQIKDEKKNSVYFK